LQGLRGLQNEENCAVVRWIFALFLEQNSAVFGTVVIFYYDQSRLFCFAIFLTELCNAVAIFYEVKRICDVM
jgi:hypothetical protein